MTYPMARGPDHEGPVYVWAPVSRCPGCRDIFDPPLQVGEEVSHRCGAIVVAVRVLELDLPATPIYVVDAEIINSRRGYTPRNGTVTRAQIFARQGAVERILELNKRMLNHKYSTELL